MKHPLIVRLITLGDQSMFALGNFLLTMLLTRYFEDVELAAFGVGLSIALLFQGVQRNSYIIQNSVLQNHIFRGRGKKILGEHLIAIQPLLAVMTLLSLGAMWSGGQDLFTLTIITTTVCFAIYANLEFERFVFVKYEQYIMPFITSFVFMVMNGAFLWFHGALSFYTLMGLLWLYACCKTLFLIAIVGMPDFKGGMVLLRSDVRRNSVSSLLGVVGASGYTHAPVLALGFLSTPTQTAALVAMRGLLQPTQIIMRSLDVIDKNLFRSKAAKAKRGMIGAMYQQIGLYFGVSAVLSLVICFYGKELIMLLYHGNHIEFINVLYGFGIISIFYAVIFPIESAIIVGKSLNDYNKMRFWVGIGVTILSLVLCFLYGAMGAVVTYIIGWVILIALSFKLVLRNEAGKK